MARTVAKEHRRAYCKVWAGENFRPAGDVYVQLAMFMYICICICICMYVCLCAMYIWFKATRDLVSQELENTPKDRLRSVVLRPGDACFGSLLYFFLIFNVYSFFLLYVFEWLRLCRLLGVVYHCSKPSSYFAAFPMKLREFKRNNGRIKKNWINKWINAWMNKWFNE